MDSQIRGWSRRGNVFWLTLYLITMAAIVWTLVIARQRSIAAFSTPEARKAWQEWREAARHQTAPVKRQVPTSEEHPTLVLMRDYFHVVLGGGLLFGSLLFVALMIAIRGSMSGSGIGTGPPYEGNGQSRRRDLEDRASPEEIA